MTANLTKSLVWFLEERMTKTMKETKTRLIYADVKTNALPQGGWEAVPTMRKEIFVVLKKSCNNNNNNNIMKSF